MNKKVNIKVYFQDVKETFLTSLIMMIIISTLSFLLRLLIVGCIVNVGIFLFFILYYRVEILFYFLVKKDIFNKKFLEKDVIFDKIETDLKYGKPKRRELFKRYTTPRFHFFFEKEMFRIGMVLDGNVYSDIRGKEFRITYLENTKVIVNIKPLFKVNDEALNKYDKVFKNISL